MHNVRAAVKNVSEELAHLIFSSRLHNPEDQNLNATQSSLSV
jgi:hypothetical protein